MHMTRYARILAGAGLLAVPVMAQHPRPEPEHIHLQGASTPTMDLLNDHGAGKDQTKHIVFDKPGGRPFTITFSTRSPCAERTIDQAHPTCTIKPPQVICKNTDAEYDAGKGRCVFHYSMGAGDPDIEIDPGYNPPPPPKPKKKKASTYKK